MQEAMKISSSRALKRALDELIFMVPSILPCTEKFPTTAHFMGKGN